MNGGNQQRDSRCGGELEERQKRLAGRYGVPGAAEIHVGWDQRFRRKPYGSNREQPGAERGGRADQPECAPRPFPGLRLRHRVEHWKDGVKPRLVEKRAHVGIDVRQTETAAMTPGRRVAPHQRANSGRVDAADTGTVDNEMLVAFGDSRLNRVFEFFSGAAFDERLMGRQHESSGALPAVPQRNGGLERPRHTGSNGPSTRSEQTDLN